MYYTTYETSSTPQVSPVVLIIYLAIAIFEIIAMWKLYTKAGKPGWAFRILRPS